MTNKQNQNNDTRMSLKTNDLEKDIWLVRLDLLFDKASAEKLNLKDSEVSDYVDFNKQNLKFIDEFISELKKLGFIFICQPRLYAQNQYNDFHSNSNLKMEILMTKILRIEFKNISVINYGYGDPNKIKDLYEIEVIDNNDLTYSYEINSIDLLRFKNKGFYPDRFGDILAISANKAMDALNLYYS